MENMEVNSDNKKSKNRWLKKLSYSIDLALFLAGIVIVLLAGKQGDVRETRTIIAGFLIAISYVLFPFMDDKKKDRLLYTLAIHLFCVIATVLGGSYAISYYLENHRLNIVQEILCTVLIVFSLTYIVYVLISFSFSFYNFVERLIDLFFKNNIDSKLKKNIEKVVALIVSLTTLLSSLVALWKAILSVGN